MATNLSEVADGKSPQGLGKNASLPKGSATDGQPATNGRFFFVRPGPHSGLPEFQREFNSEAEAMAESFKAGVSYYALIEYRSLVDCSGKQPTFKKEVVKRNP